MRISKHLVTAVALASPLAAQAAPRLATTLPADELAHLEAVRKDVWVRWFTGDTAAMRSILGPELVAISPDGEHWQSLDETLEGSARFAASGAELVSVTFDSTLVHRFDAVVVMFSHYAVTIMRAGTRSIQKGRATELFVRSGGRWVHTSWHLDVVP